MQYLKEDIQEKILHIAEEVFSEKGYKDASMREIASRTGITVSNIYHYFTNKDEIFRTILKPVLNDLYAKIYSHDANQMSIEVFTNSDAMTRTIFVFFQGMKQKYPHLNIGITDFFIHLNTVWLFALLEELVLHHVKKEEMQKFIAEYIAFETAGWKELMNV